MNRYSNEPIEEIDMVQKVFNSRKKRQTVTIDIVKRIRKYVDKKNSAKNIADTEDLTSPTVYKILNKISDGVSDENGDRHNNFQLFKTRYYRSY